MWSLFPTEREAIMCSMGLGFRVLTRLTHIFVKWQREKAGTEIWGLLLPQRPLHHVSLWSKLQFIVLNHPSGTFPTSVTSRHALFSMHSSLYWLVWESRGQSDQGQSLRHSCSLTTHSSLNRMNAEPNSASQLALQSIYCILSYKMF